MIKGIGPVFDDCLLNYESVIKENIGGNSSQMNMKEIKDLLPLDFELNIKSILPQTLAYVYNGIRLTRHALKGRIPLIGFVGGPLTLLFYSIEGKSSKKHWQQSKRWLYQYPMVCHAILQLYTKAIILHLIHQAKNGAQVLEVFESLVGFLVGNIFRSMILPYLQQIYIEVRNEIECEIPIILFARDVNIPLSELVGECGYEVYSLGWRQSASECRMEVGDKCTLQVLFLFAIVLCYI